MRFKRRPLSHRYGKVPAAKVLKYFIIGWVLGFLSILSAVFLGEVGKIILIIFLLTASYIVYHIEGRQE